MPSSGCRYRARCTDEIGCILSMRVAGRCFLRGLPLFFAARPGTPLRVLCIMAFDTLHGLRTSQRLPIHRIRILAALLDFGACANAAIDGKRFRPAEFCRTRQLLENAGIGLAVDEYYRQLKALESRRPCPGGDRLNYQRVRMYREEVVRLSLGILATITLGHKCLEDGIKATCNEQDLILLFGIVMQCQIIDDIVDYSKDAAAGLSGFLTASESLSEAFALTYQATRCYGSDQGTRGSVNLLPFRIALFALTAISKLLITLGRWRQRISFVEPLPDHTPQPTIAVLSK